MDEPFIRSDIEEESQQAAEVQEKKQEPVKPVARDTSEDEELER